MIMVPSTPKLMNVRMGPCPHIYAYSLKEFQQSLAQTLGPRKVLRSWILQPRDGGSCSLRGKRPAMAAVPGAERGAAPSPPRYCNTRDLHLLKHLGRNEAQIMLLLRGGFFFFQFQASRPACHQRGLGVSPG